MSTATCYCNQLIAGDTTIELPCRRQHVAGSSPRSTCTGSSITAPSSRHPDGDALDASDCRVGGYVQSRYRRHRRPGQFLAGQDRRHVDPAQHGAPRAGCDLDCASPTSGSSRTSSCSDWPPAGQIQLEGLVYDHFDDDSPLTVEDRLAWLRRQYAPIGARRAECSNPEPRCIEVASPSRSAASTARTCSSIIATLIAGRVMPAGYADADGDSCRGIRRSKWRGRATDMVATGRNRTRHGSGSDDGGAWHRSRAERARADVGAPTTTNPRRSRGWL